MKKNKLQKILTKSICVLGILAMTACGTNISDELPSVRFEYGKESSEVESSFTEQNTIASENETSESEVVETTIVENEAPTTEAPTTEAPTTEAPTTEAPTTEAPITEAPTTEAPTTEAPTTETPTTEAPTSSEEVPAWVRELSLDRINAINQSTFRNANSGLKYIGTITAITGSQVRAYIEKYTIPANCTYYNGSAVTEEQKAHLLALRNLDAIGDSVSLRYAIMTENAPVRSFPTADKMTTSTDANAFDYLQESMFKVGEGVVVLHETADKSYAFVMGENYSGWVKTTRMGMTTYEQFADWVNSLEKTPMTVITRCAVVNGRYLRMGTKLPLVSQANGTFTVKFPTANNGNLEVVMMQVPDDGKCVNGYIPFTRINVVDRLDMLVGMPYGWGDTDANMDCSSTMGAIFATFGITLPRNSGDMKYTGTKVTDISSMTAVQKESFISNTKPGTLLVMPGHVMMYVGEVNGVMTIGHNVTTYSLDGVNAINAYQCVKTPLQIYSVGGASYVDRLTYVIEW